MNRQNLLDATAIKAVKLFRRLMSPTGLNNESDRCCITQLAMAFCCPASRQSQSQGPNLSLKCDLMAGYRFSKTGARDRDEKRPCADQNQQTG